MQPEFDFSASGDPRAHPQTALVPVADLHERRQAGLLDLIFLALAYVGFLGLFRSLGGHFYFARVDAVVYAAAFVLFYALYFSIFTIFGGATPGMQLRGLYVVRLDGTLAENRQLLWRAFAYLLSAGALMLGFSLGLLGRGPFHLARSHFAYLRHLGAAARPGRLLRGRATAAANLGAQVASTIIAGPCVSG